MDRHLIPIKVRVIGSAGQRMELQSASFRQHRFKGLNAQAMKGRRPVQKNRMFLDNFLQNVPHFRLYAFHHALCRLDVSHDAVVDQFLHDKGLEEFQRHLLGEAALMKLQFRPHNDDRTAGIIHALS